MTDLHRRLIRNYLLDRKYQLRYTLIMVLISSLLTATLGYIWYQQVRATSSSIEMRSLTNLGFSEKEVQEIRDEMAGQDRFRLVVLIGFGVLFALATACYGIIITHKVAGPLYKISRYMNDIKEGRLGKVYDLRRGDHLRDFFESFKQMHTALRQQAYQRQVVLDETINSLEQCLQQNASNDLSAQMSPILNNLKTIRDDTKHSLESSA